MKLTVIGLGHIGGTIAKTLKKIDPTAWVVGVDANPAHGREALAAGWVDTVAALPEGLQGVDLVALTVPVKAIKRLLPEVLKGIGPDTVVFDAGSTKAAICEAVAGCPNRDQFVAAHPIAGTENSGPSAAMDTLFQGKRMIFCETEKSAPWAVERVARLFEAMEMELLYMEPHDHDVHLAYISHMSHLTSFSLALSVLRAERDEDKIFQFAGSGFDSTARLGKSSPEMWAPIFLENKEPLLKVLDKYLHILGVFRAAIEADDTDQLKSLMAEANDIRRILEGAVGAASSVTTI